MIWIWFSAFTCSAGWCVRLFLSFLNCHELQTKLVLFCSFCFVVSLRIIHIVHHCRYSNFFSFFLNFTRKVFTSLAILFASSGKILYLSSFSFIGIFLLYYCIVELTKDYIILAIAISHKGYCLDSRRIKRYGNSSFSSLFLSFNKI